MYKYKGIYFNTTYIIVIKVSLANSPQLQVWHFQIFAFEFHANPFKLPLLNDLYNIHYN